MIETILLPVENVGNPEFITFAISVTLYLCFTEWHTLWITKLVASLWLDTNPKLMKGKAEQGEV